MALRGFIGLKLGKSLDGIILPAEGTPGFFEVPYAIAIQLDLFNRPVIVRAWGGRGSRRGGMATEPFSTARLKDIDRRRRQHGYQLLQNHVDRRPARGSERCEKDAGRL
ncbi:hypothetical protein [Chromobacterium sp. ATCC 53434]|uniref:hypothetical protein n=1 Tax=Chromobacterium sp. (strain ATCC 53434 / SC 14030) TaxID=2059672 RepID=UPI0013052FA0|nr:hypothetical protein [Chromobacterium sp. ATCC 53434]